MLTMRDVDDLKLQRRATMSLPWLQAILHGCEANLAARQQETERTLKQAEEERQAQARSLDEQIAAAVAAAMQAQTSRNNGQNPQQRTTVAPPQPPDAEGLASAHDTTRAGVSSTRSRCAGTTATPAAPAGLATSSPMAATAKGNNDAPARDAHRAQERRPCSHHPSASALRRARRRTSSWPRACPRAAPTVPSSGAGIARAITSGTTRSTTVRAASPSWKHPSALSAPMSCARWRSGR